jgi:hypothetical protein
VRHVKDVQQPPKVYITKLQLQWVDKGSEFIVTEDSSNTTFCYRVSDAYIFVLKHRRFHYHIKTSYRWSLKGIDK